MAKDMRLYPTITLLEMKTAKSVPVPADAELSQVERNLVEDLARKRGVQERSAITFARGYAEALRTFAQALAAQQQWTPEQAVAFQALYHFSDSPRTVLFSVTPDMKDSNAIFYMNEEDQEKHFDQLTFYVFINPLTLLNQLASLGAGEVHARREVYTAAEEQVVRAVALYAYLNEAVSKLGQASVSDEGFLDLEAAVVTYQSTLVPNTELNRHVGRWQTVYRRMIKAE